MGNNLLRGTIDTGALKVLVYCEDARIGGLLDKSLEKIGCTGTTVADSVDAAVAAMDDLVPSLVIMVSDVGDPEKLEQVRRINRKRVLSKGRTPKILGLISPSIDDIMKAKKAGFYDVLPLPVTPNGLMDRLETVLTRMD